jgi:hypothetical protein
MATAQRLYSSRGFVERTPYEGTEIPVRLQQYWLFFETTSAPFGGGAGTATQGTDGAEHA